MTATEVTERGLGSGKDISVAESYKKQIWFSITTTSLSHLGIVAGIFDEVYWGNYSL